MSKMSDAFSEILELLQEGVSPEDVAQIMDIPVEWVIPIYYSVMTGDPYDAE